MGSVVTSSWIFQSQMRQFRRFGSVAILYVVRSTIGLLDDSYASCYLQAENVKADIALHGNPVSELRHLPCGITVLPATRHKRTRPA